MKRVFIAALAMAFLLSLAACGSTSSESQTPAGSTPAQTEAPGAGGTEKSNFPEKTITIVVPYDAGGASDLMSRVFAAALSEQLNGATVVVENRSGGSGAVGMEYANSQPSDGYTILYLETNQTMIRHYGFTELEPSAFIQMACTHVQPAVLAVSAGSEWDSLEDFIDYAKENPGKVSIGDAGTGCSPLSRRRDGGVCGHGRQRGCGDCSEQRGPGGGGLGRPAGHRYLRTVPDVPLSRCAYRR